MALTVSRQQVRGFRLRAQNLSKRLDAAHLVAAAGQCGVQNSPPTSAIQALGARVDAVSPATMERAIVADKSLVQTWSVRGAPFVFPTRDAAVFTAGALPPTEAGRLHLLQGVEPALRELCLSLEEAVDLTRSHVGEVLSGRGLPINELGAQLSQRIVEELDSAHRLAWERPGPYGPDQPLGEAVVHFCLRIVALEGLICFSQRSRNKAPFVLVSEWLGAPIQIADPAQSRAELLRRYLGSYGPSSPRDFAAWVGVRTGDARAWWELLDGELAEVDFAGPAWILAADLDALAGAPEPMGVRLLPPRDPYTQARDRDTIVERERSRQVFKAIGEPGALLIDGAIEGIWRPRKRDETLTIALSAFAPLPDRHRRMIEAEADHVARARGASRVRVEFSSD